MTKENDSNIVNDAVKSGGSYDIIKTRLTEQGKSLTEKTHNLNELRKKEFGSSKNEILTKIKVRTSNNCIPIDMAQVNGQLLVGYQVNVGMKSSIPVSDLFSLYNVTNNNNEMKLEEVDISGTFLDDPMFVKSFNELMTYYKGNKLVQISRKQEYLYVCFQIGSVYSDRKVFKWHIQDDKTVYVNDKANDEFSAIDPYCFEWIETTRENHVLGKEPHVSIIDKVFVETVNGDLTIKVENNTEDGLGIYNEPVKDQKQVLEDAQIYYAEVNDLIILKIKPYNEDFRYFIFNTVTESVIRVDSLKNACQELPENHGVVFPDGYYLANGDYKVFENESENLQYFTTVSSPNGEDYLYVFFDPIDQCYVLYSYNLISKRVDNPIHAHGYSMYPNGNVTVFRHSENSEASKVHPLTIWKTPYFSDEYFLELEKLRSLENRNRELLNIGNAELVSAVSDLYTVINFIKKDEVSTSLYEGIIRSSQLIIDDYHWLGNDKFDNIKDDLKAVIETSELVVEEFEKVKAIQKNAIEVLDSTKKEHDELVSKIKLTSPDKATDYVVVLSEINQHIGHLISIKTQRYIDVEEIEKMHVRINEQKDDVNERLLKLLQNKKSFDVYIKYIENVETKMSEVKKVVDIEPLEEKMEDINDKITIINNEINEIEAKDSTVTSMILDHVSEVFAKLNQVNAKIKQLKKSFLSKEAKTEFVSQFKLLTQSVSNSLGRATTPEKCDEEIAVLIGLIEKLESKFSDFDEYLTEIYQKRDEINDAFENHKQQLVNATQKRIANIVKAGEINLNSISKKVEKFNTIDELNTYFSSDVMVLKVRTLIENIKEIGGTVQAEDLESKLVKIKDMSMRSLRDNQDIFEDGGNIMKMGKHKFPVNKVALDLTILNKDGQMQSHLTSTDYFNTVVNEKFNELQHLWDADLPSESKDVYRAEYLAYLVLSDALTNQNDLSLKSLIESRKNRELLPIISRYTDSLYKDSYIKGVHDHDAEKFLDAIVGMYSQAGLLTYSQEARSLGVIFAKTNFNKEMTSKYINAKKLKDNLNNATLWQGYVADVKNEMTKLFKDKSDILLSSAAEFYIELAISKLFEYSKEAIEAFKVFESYIERESLTLIEEDNLLDHYEMICLWIESVLRNRNKNDIIHYVKDAASLYFLKDFNDIKTEEKKINLSVTIEGLIGDHVSLEEGKKKITLDDYITRVKYHKDVYYPSFEAFIKLRQEISNNEKEKLCLEDFKSKPLTSFVRNKLITDVYFPMIGDNFAKQMGTIGESKRTDLMGLLLLISPPGYGKTTLIEYVANKLGLVFVKVNCPSIGHSVTSLDPREASDSTSEKEINKINLAFEMGSNVLLYLDDIQHTNPEFLQKFISLCDGTRRVEGVWEGKTKTYDMRGKKFAVVMAGNPYTETGETFKIPDMLANRADIYNLGDILGGKVDTFKLSYIENSLTSNKVLAPLATRGMDDVYKLIKMAQGEQIALDELDHTYSPAEVNEIKNVITHMLKIQDVVFAVNMEYIKSAATADEYRVEPPFKLQGSYRNMNKMTEKLVAVMNDDEITNLIIDHYTGESQTLTTGAEANMLKLKSLMEQLTEDESTRWDMICSEFKRNRQMGDESDSTRLVANQLSLMTEVMKEKSTKKDDKVNNENNISEHTAMLTELVHLIKDNQSEDKLIELFSDRIESLNKSFVDMVDRRDKEQMKIFKPMILYFNTLLKKYEEKEEAKANEEKNKD